MPMLTNPTLLTESRHDFAEILQNTGNGQRQLHATRSFAPGDIICNFYAGETLTVPTYLTVQLNDAEHITLKPVFLQYINHSCDPNVFFDTSSMQLVCQQPIEPGDEFTFFYPSTEWAMVQPFKCHCGSADCLKQIQGARYLSDETLSRYRLTDFIKRKLQDRQG
jgi:hypothetical protein